MYVNMSQLREFTNITDAAITWHNAGCCVVPAQTGKRPLFDWKEFQDKRPTEENIRSWYSVRDDLGIGIICGAISGGLEMLELEGRAATGDHISLILEACKNHPHGDVDIFFEMLLTDGYAEWTPSGGLHLLYRITDHEVPGNRKVARRPATAKELADNPDDKTKVLAETRGEGGFVVVAPSAGTVHPLGGTWSVAAGQLGVVPAVDWEMRCALHEAIHTALDEMPEPVIQQRPPAASLLPRDGSRPGDDFNERAEWREILEPHGWRIHHATLQETYWTRPGKPKVEGWSATTGYDNSVDRLYVWSSSTNFEPEKPYNKFSAYTLLEHNGDFAGAARELGRRGYGSSATTTSYVAGTLPTQELAPRQPQTSDATVSESASAEIAVRDKLGIPVYRGEEMANAGMDQLSLADKWEQLHHDTFQYLPAQDVWMRWDEKVWIRDDLNRHRLSMHHMLDKYLQYAESAEAINPAVGGPMVKKAKSLRTDSNIRGLVRLAADKPQIAATAKDFDCDPALATTDDGVMNLDTFGLLPHNPKFMLTRKMNTSYSPTHATGRFTKFMEEVLPDKDVRDYLQRVCGYMLTGDMSERVMVMIHGESGTGKTQFLEALYQVMGDFAGIAPASAFQPRQQGYKGPSEDLHKLMGKRFVIQSELDAGTKLNESLIKAITGADTQTTRDLYGKPVDWKPEYTVFMATNYLPRISSSDGAIWNRVKPIKFERKFINDHGEALNPADRSLGRRMAKEEPEVIFNWLLEGVRAYRERGLDEPAQVAAWLRDYRDDVDTTRQFLIEAPEEGHVVVEQQQQVGVRDLYRAYHAWCTDNALMPVGSKTFAERLLSSGWKKEKRAKGIMWQGIGLAGFMIQSQTATRNWYDRRE